MYDFDRVNVEDEKGKFKVWKGKNDSLHTFVSDSGTDFPFKMICQNNTLS